MSKDARTCDGSRRVEGGVKQASRRIHEIHETHVAAWPDLLRLGPADQCSDGLVVRLIPRRKVLEG